MGREFSEKASAGLVLYDLPAKAWKNRVVIMWLFISIFGVVLQTIVFNKAGLSMPSFPFFLLWFTAPLFTVAFIVMYVLSRYAFRIISAEETALPHWWLFVMGALSALNGLLLVFSNPHVPGFLQSLLGPNTSTIPMTMILSYIILRTRFTWLHIIGGATVLCGLVVCVVPNLDTKLLPHHDAPGLREEANFTPSWSTPTSTYLPIAASTAKTLPSWLWDIFWILGSLPIAATSVLQEKVFTQVGTVKTDRRAAWKPPSLLYVLTFSTMYQTLVIMLMLPFDMIPGFNGNGSVGHGSVLHDFADRQYAAMQCLFKGTNDVLKPGQCDDCRCDVAGLYFGLFILSYIIGNLGNIGLVKSGSAVLVYITIALSVPIQLFCFRSEVIMAPFAVLPMSLPFTAAAIVIIYFGFTLYVYSSVKASRRCEETEETAPLLEGEDDNDSFADNPFARGGAAGSKRTSRARSHSHVSVLNPASISALPIVHVSSHGNINSS